MKRAIRNFTTHRSDMRTNQELVTAWGLGRIRRYAPIIFVGFSGCNDVRDYLGKIPHG